MANFKYIYTPQESIYDIYEYQFSSTTLKIKHTMLLNDEYVVNELYYNIENLELNKHYSTQYPLIEIETVNDELLFNLLYALPTEDEYGAFEPEILDVEFEDFEIPEDAEIIQLEELVVSEPEENIIEKLEGDNRALTLRMEELKKQMESDQKANEEMTLELLELMMGLR